ncbi:MAG: hypothetical protein IV103_04970 [Zoogloea sp.]|nr:hypothetical protein [Zoogloea sp.]
MPMKYTFNIYTTISGKHFMLPAQQGMLHGQLIMLRHQHAMFGLAY